jgi:hypothetical protein
MWHISSVHPCACVCEITIDIPVHLEMLHIQSGHEFKGGRCMCNATTSPGYATQPTSVSQTWMCSLSRCVLWLCSSCLLNRLFSLEPGCVAYPSLSCGCAYPAWICCTTDFLSLEPGCVAYPGLSCGCAHPFRICYPTDFFPLNLDV